MAEKVLNVNVISPESILYQGVATSLRIPGTDGSFGVLYNHAALVSEVEYGILHIKNGEQTTRIFIDGGFVQITKNTVNILARSGEALSKLNSQDLNSKLNELNSKKDLDSLLESKKIKAKLAAIS